MGVLNQAVVIGIRKLKEKYTHSKKKKNKQSVDRVEDHIYEDLSSIAYVDKNVSNKISSEKNSSLNSLSDSGISDADCSKKKFKQLKFSVAEIHEFERSDVEKEDMSLLKCKAKYTEVASPQKIKYLEGTSFSVGYSPSSNTVQYIDPCDLVTTSVSQYALPVKTRRPPKSSICLRNRLDEQNDSCYTEAMGHDSRIIYAEITPFPIETRSTENSVCDTQETPRHSRNIENLTPSKFSTPIRTFDRQSIESIDLNDIPTHKLPASSEIFNKESKECFDLIDERLRNMKNACLTSKPDCGIQENLEYKKSLDKKYIINMFESRPSGRWEKLVRNNDKEGSRFSRKSFIRMSADSKTAQKTKTGSSKPATEMDSETLEKKTNSIAKQSSELQTESKQQLKKRREFESIPSSDERLAKDLNMKPISSNDDQNQTCKLLRESRDVECSRMAQASKVLEKIRQKGGKINVMDLLIVEKILLETNERLKLVSHQIRENTYCTISEPALHKGSLRLSNITFSLKKSPCDTSKNEKQFTEFFLMTVSHGTRLFISDHNSTVEDDNNLTFQTEFQFSDVPPDFDIKVKLFHSRIHTKHKFFWEKFMTSSTCPTSRIIFEDRLYNEFKERTVYLPSFKLCAETTLTYKHINTSCSNISIVNGQFDRINGVLEYQFKCQDVDLDVTLSGFLDVGYLLRETFYWERKWCALQGPNLKIYNYPGDEDFREPVEQINLRYCFGPIVTKIDNCPKKRCFHLRTGIPSDSLSNRPSLKSKPNFAQRKFFFVARDKEEYIRWTLEVEKVLDSLSYFKKLVFDEEYGQCAR